MKNTLYALFSFALIALSGCASFLDGETNRVDAIKSRVGFDLNCTADKVTIQVLGDRTYGVVGCGKKVTYTTDRCWSGDVAGCTAQLVQIPNEK